MTCKDCLHYDACFDNQTCGEFEFVTNVDYEDMKEWCGAFKNKADFVEVVRCKDCKYQDDCAGQMVHTTRDYVLEQNISTYNKVDFCSYGEPKDKLTKIEHSSLCETETYLKG